MGSETSKSEAPPSPKFARPWRDMNWGAKDSLEKSLSSFKPSCSEFPFIRILIVGPIGSGKSSFINSVNNAFQGRITSGALVGTIAGTSFTTKYETHYFEGRDGSRLPFVMNDIMGLEDKDGRGVHQLDLVSALQGLIEENYTFNPVSPLTRNEPRSQVKPKVEDQIFCLVNILPADTVSQMENNVFSKMQFIRKAATLMNIPQVLILTKPDLICPLVKENIKHIYTSKKIKAKMQESSNLLGVPMNNIFPVKNYHEEIDTKNDMDVLILKALDQIVNIANDAQKKKASKSNKLE